MSMNNDAGSAEPSATRLDFHPLSVSLPLGKRVIYAIDEAKKFLIIMVLAEICLAALLGIIIDITTHDTQSIKIVTLCFGLTIPFLCILCVLSESAFVNNVLRGQLFAKANGFSYFRHGIDSAGILQRLRPSGKSTGRYFPTREFGIVSGVYNNRPFSMATLRQFRHSGGIGYFMARLSVTLPKSLPYILVYDARKTPDTGKLPKIEKVPLSSEFDKRFMFFCAVGHSQQALSIVTPEMLRILADNDLPFSITTEDNDLHFYAYGYLTYDKKLTPLLFKLQDVIGNTSSLSI